MTVPAPMAWPEALDGRAAKLEPFWWYRRMLEPGVRYDEERNCWDAFSYDAVTTVLGDVETYSSETAADDGGGGLPSMLDADPPQHTRLREPVEEYVRPRTVRSLAPYARRPGRCSTSQNATAPEPTGWTSSTTWRGRCPSTPSRRS